MSYKRMLAPPYHRRRVDVPDEMVKDKLADGYILDPAPDRRPMLHGSTVDRHKGRAAFIAASGPSMSVHALQEIVGFIQEQRCVVWGTNDVWRMAGGAAMPCDYVMVLDDSFWYDKREKLAEYFVAHPHALPCLAFDPPEILDYQKIPIAMDREPHTNPPYEPNAYFNGYSSGIAAVNMALHCGCDPVYLLGHDCGTALGKTHGAGVRSQAELAAGYPQGLQMIAGYATLARHAREIGRKIVNLSALSKLECFEKQSLGDSEWRRAIRRSGDPSSSRRV
jgi:hypothetical protein